jgi:hypothetical protein
MRRPRNGNQICRLSTQLLGWFLVPAAFRALGW